MTKDRSKKRAIRERMEKTDESYMTARAQILAAADQPPPVRDVLIRPSSAAFAFRVARGPGRPPSVVITRCVFDRGTGIERQMRMSLTGRYAVALRNAVSLFLADSTAAVMSSELADDFPDAALDARTFEQLAQVIGPHFAFIHEPGSSFALCFGRARMMPSPNPSAVVSVFTFSESGQLSWSSTLLHGVPAREFRTAVNLFVPAPPRAPLTGGEEDGGNTWGRTLDDVWHLAVVPNTSPLTYLCGVDDPHVREFIEVPEGTPPTDRTLCKQCLTMTP